VKCCQAAFISGAREPHQISDSTAIVRTTCPPRGIAARAFRLRSEAASSASRQPARSEPPSRGAEILQALRAGSDPIGRLRVRSLAIDGQIRETLPERFSDLARGAEGLVRLERLRQVRIRNLIP
jgi:hypothetical protein